jgi:acetylornithine deacetylase/succinyl-diaminopimelate desuccinylase-like protein
VYVRIQPAIPPPSEFAAFWITGGAGLETFGVSGTFVDISDLRAHGKDERIGVSEFYQSLEFSYRLIKQLTAH